MPVKRINLVGNSFSRAVSDGFSAVTTYDQRFKNCVIGVLENPVTGQRTPYLQGVEEDVSIDDVPSGATGGGTAIHVWAGVGEGTSVVTAFGATNSTVYVDNTSLGSTTGLVKFISETSVSDVGTLLFQVGGARGYYYTNGGALTEITDTDFPTKTPALTITGQFVELDGYVFIMTTNGRIYNSDINSVSSWTSSSYITASSKLDAGVGLAKIGRKIVAVSNASIEFFVNEGNAAGSPLSRSGDPLDFGCFQPEAICEVAGAVFLAGRGSKIVPGVFMLDGNGHKRISTSEIDQVLGMANPTNVKMFPAMLRGKQCVLLKTQTSSAEIWAYDTSIGMWFTLTTNAIIVQAAYRPSNSTGSGRWVYVHSGNVYYAGIATSYKTYEVRTAPLDFGTTKRKLFSSFELVADTTSTTQNATVSFAVDNRSGFGSARTLDLSKRKKRFDRGPSFFDLQVKVIMPGNEARLFAMDIDILECSS